MARFGQRADEMNSAREPRQPGLTRRKLIAGFLTITALVSTVALVARPAPPPEQTAQPERTADIEPVEPAEAPERAPAPKAEVIDSIRVRVTCIEGVMCIVDPLDENERSISGRAITICENDCSESTRAIRTYTLTPGGKDVDGSSLPVVQGFERSSEINRRITRVAADQEAPADFVQMRTQSSGRVEFDNVGDPGMRLDTTYREPAGETTFSPSGGTIASLLQSLFIGLLIVVFLAVVVLAMVVLAQVLMTPTSKRTRLLSNDDGGDDDVEVTAPLELAQPVTKEVAQERAAVAQDLLDRVRDIDDPRMSIQTGFSLLETGFGRMHLARRRNETANAYITRVFGDHEDLRPTIAEVSALFQRARFSDLRVDSTMRTEMIERLEQVQRTWKQEAVILGDAAAMPAPPSAVSIGAHDIGDDT